MATIPAQSTNLNLPTEGTIFRATGDNGDAVYKVVNGKIETIALPSFVANTTFRDLNTGTTYKPGDVLTNSGGNVQWLDPNYRGTASSRTTAADVYQKQTGTAFNTLPEFNMGDITTALDRGATLGSANSWTLNNPAVAQNPNMAWQQNTGSAPAGTPSIQPVLAPSIQQNTAQNTSTATPPVVPSTINTGNTTGATTPTIPPANPPANTNGVVAGAAGYVSSNPVDTTYTDKSTALLKELEGLYQTDTGKTAYSQGQLDVSGATALEAKQKDLAARLEAINLQDKAIPLQMEGDAAGKGLTSGILDRQTTEARRQNAIGALSIQAEYAINAGQLDTARLAAKKAVDLKYADIESEIDQKVKLLSLYSPFMSKEQQKEAIAQANEVADVRAETLANKQLQLDLVNYAQSSGDTARMSQLLALDPSATNFKTQLGSIAGAIIPKTSGASTTYVDEGGRRYAVTLDTQGNKINKIDIGASSNAGTTSVTSEDATGKYVSTLDSSGKLLNKVRIGDPTQTADQKNSTGYTQAEKDQLTKNRNALIAAGVQNVPPDTWSGAAISTGKSVTGDGIPQGMTSSDISSIENSLKTGTVNGVKVTNPVGGDGFIDPNMYVQMMNYWISKQGTKQAFFNQFPYKTYINPANTWIWSQLGIDNPYVKKTSTSNPY